MLKKIYAQLMISATILGVAAAGCAAPVTMSQDEKALLITMNDLRDFGILTRNPSPGEVYDATRYSDGIVEFEYEYDSENDPTNHEYVFVKSDAEISKTPEQAEVAFDDRLLGYELGLAIDGVDVSVVEDPNLIGFGDESYSAYMLSDDGVRRGNLIVVRQENVVLSLILAGYYFDNPEPLSKLLRPRLEQALK